jgi:high-affinity Fe2+/Pb2+ permease
MKLRRLKIAVSAASVLACLLLIALAVRSHRKPVACDWNGWRKIIVWSGFGQIQVTMFNHTNPDEPLYRWWHSAAFLPGGFRPWYFQWVKHQIFIAFPEHFPIVVLILLAALPWVHLRYSLRSMLIAVTIIAVLLALMFSFWEREKGAEREKGSERLSRKPICKTKS